jgi:predicted dehydrogenase
VAEGLRVGIVGVGNNAATHHLPAYRLLPNVEVAACCATTPERAQAGAVRLGIPKAYTDVDAMIRGEKLDAVSICSTNDAHYQNTVDALHAGAHVLCEKPMALNTHQARAMCDAAEQSGRQAMVAYTYRFVPAAKMARELISSGELGELSAVQATYLSAYLADTLVPVEKSWKLQKGHGGGVLGDLGSHLIYLTRWWCGEVFQACGVRHTIVPKRRGLDGSDLSVDVDDACGFCLQCASGVTAHCFVTKYATGRLNHQRIDVYGNKGALVYDVERPGELEVCLGKRALADRSWATLKVPDRLGNPRMIGRLEAYRFEQVRTFVESILRSQSVEPSFADGLACQQVIDAVAASADTPGWVSIELSRNGG